MSPTLVIAGREIWERRFILLTALVLGVLPFAFSLVPSLDTDPRDLTALLLSLAFPPAVAFAVGASILGRDVAERRIGFYFARPISAFSLWGGKYLGAVVLVLLSVLLVAGPVASVNGTAAEFATGKIPFPLRVLAPGLFLFIGGAHFAASAYRSRSPLIVLDIAFAAAAFASLGAVTRTMVYAGAGDVCGSAQPSLVAVSAAALLLAPGAQLAVGRVDARRGHAVLSMAVWALGSSVLLAFFVWSRWVLSVTPQQAGGVAYGVAAAPSSGVAVLFNGAGRAGYSPVFVMDGSSGAYVRFSSERMSVPAFTRDGLAAAWFARRPLGLPQSVPTLAVARFDGGHPTVDEVALQEAPDDGRVLALDQAGARAVLADRSSVVLVDTTTGRTTARASVPGTVAADFRPGGGLRLLQELPRQPPMPFGGAGFAVSDWYPARSAVVERWRHETEGPSRLLVVHGDRAFTTSNGRDGLLIDLESGARTSVETPWTKAGPAVHLVRAQSCSECPWCFSPTGRWPSAPTAR